MTGVVCNKIIENPALGRSSSGGACLEAEEAIQVCKAAALKVDWHALVGNQPCLMAADSRGSSLWVGRLTGGREDVQKVANCWKKNAAALSRIAREWGLPKEQVDQFDQSANVAGNMQECISWGEECFFCGSGDLGVQGLMATKIETMGDKVYFEIRELLTNPANLTSPLNKGKQIRGVGMACIEQAKKSAWAGNCEAIILIPSSGAKKFYRNQGFKNWILEGEEASPLGELILEKSQF